MRRADADGRLYKRKSRCTGKELPTWWCAYTVDRKERRESTGTEDKEEAKAFLRKRMVAVDDGTITKVERERLTVATILDLVRGNYALKGYRSAATVGAHLKNWATALGAKTRALDVTTGKVQRVLERWRARGDSAATCNRRLSNLRRAYRLAKLRLDPGTLDFSELFLPEDGLRGHYMAPDVFAKICAELPAYVRAFFMFAYLTGVRKQQLARTTVAHVNTSTMTITWSKQETKAKKDHVIHLDGDVLDLVQKLLAHRLLHCRYLFHGRRCEPGHVPSHRYGCIGDIKKVWRSAVQRAGFTVGRADGFVFHNTRHSAVTNLSNAGVPAHDAMEISGHRTRSVFDRYNIGTEKQQRAALRAVSLYTEQVATKTTVVPLRRTATD